MAKNPLIYAVPAILLAGAAAFAADAPPDSGDLQRQLSDAQDKLSTSLHSYSLLQDEESQLKADADKGAADKAALAAQLDAANATINGLRAQAAVAPQVDVLRIQLRQTQDELAALAMENAQLKIRPLSRRPFPRRRPRLANAAGTRGAKRLDRFHTRARSGARGRARGRRGG